MVDGYSDLDGEVSTTTILPAPQNPAATVNTNSVTVSADPVTDADGYRFYRAEASGTVLADYTQIADEPTPSYDDSTLEDGEKYYYRIVAYTADATSDPSAEVNAVAFLPAPTVTLTENSPNGVLVEWTKEDNSTDGNWRIDRREQGATAWTTIANPILSDRSYTDASVAAGSYEYRVVRVTNHDPEAETTASITIGVAAETQGFVIGEGSNAVQWGPGEVVAKDIQKTHTGIATAVVEVPETDAAIPNVQRQDRADYYVAGECVFTGFAVSFSGNDRTGKWSIDVDGIGKRLEETRPDYESLGGTLTYSNIALDDALKDYWPRTPFNVTVTEQVPETVASNELVQSADTQTEWQNLFSPPDTLPITITSSEALTLQQTCFTTEAENYTLGSATVGTFSGYSNNNNGITFESVGDYAEYEFNVNHVIAGSDFELYVRGELSSGGVGDAISVSVDGTSIGRYESSNPALEWLTTANLLNYSSPGELRPGDNPHTLRFEKTGANDDLVSFDVVAPADGTYNYTLDNSLDANGYLSGPETHPDSVTVESASTGTAYNISTSDLSVVIDDASGSQALAVSNDNGATYTSASNTSTLSHDYADAGREARVRFTLSRYGSRTTATPTTGYQGQTIDSFTHRVDLNDLTVIDELELSRNHFDNLKKLHNYGSFQYTIEHDDSALGDLTVNSYPKGAITKSTPEAFQNPENRSPEVAAETYFNSVYLQGQLRADGTRPTAEVKDQTAINNDGREISPGVLRDPSISTEAGADFRAAALLERALSNNELRGSISTFPVYREPGYAYELDWGNGPTEKTLESVSIRESTGSISASYEFVVREALAETLNSLRQNSRDVSDQV